MSKSTRTKAAGTRPLRYHLCINANTSGFELDHHNVFFATDYERVFTTIFQSSPSVRTHGLCLCPDRVNGKLSTEGKERLLPLKTRRQMVITVHGPIQARATTQERFGYPSRRFKTRLRREDVTCPDNWHQRFPGGAPLRCSVPWDVF